MVHVTDTIETHLETAGFLSEWPGLGEHRELLLRIWTALPFLFAVCLAGCNSMGPDDNIVVNPKLKYVLYIGSSETNPAYEPPNEGYPSESILSPVWSTPSNIYAFSRQAFDASRNVVGIFNITINPGTLDYVSHVAHEFRHNVWTLGYDPAVSKLLVIYTDIAGYTASHLSISELLLTEEPLIPSSWSPWGIAAWPQRSGVIFYGENPLNQVRGFYYHSVSESGGVRDSLLYAVALTRFAARGMSVRNDGQYLYFSEGDRHLHFFQLDLTQRSSAPSVLAEREGGFGQIIPNPLNSDLVLLNYSFGGDATTPPQSHIELLNTTSMSAADLDVRTNPRASYFLVNDHPWWSPDGNHFAFSAGFSTGETSGSPLTLWVYRNVP